MPKQPNHGSHIRVCKCSNIEDNVEFRFRGVDSLTLCHVLLYIFVEKGVFVFFVKFFVFIAIEPNLTNCLF